MRIAVNTRFLLKGKLEGIGTFTAETLKRIAKNHPEHTFIFIFDRPWDKEFIFADNVIPVAAFPQARHPFLYYLWFEWSVPVQLKKHKADVFLSPDGYLSLSADIPQIQVIHDLAFEHFPKDVSFWGSRYYKFYFPKFAEKAKRIAAVSKFTKSDVTRIYGIPEQKIDIVYNGAADHFKPLEKSKQSEIRNKFTEGNPFFLYVGAIHPRKNIGRLLQAYDKFREKDPRNIKLLIVGRRGWQNKELLKIYGLMKYREDVIFAGRVADPDLAGIMASAFALTYISTFEGFGIPILEAMKSGTPVITSQSSSMPEVADAAALFADPYSVESIQNALEKMANDPILRENLKQKGLERAKDFSWDKSAEMLWECITKVIGKK